LTRNSLKRAIHIPENPDLEASSNELLVDGQHGNDGIVRRPVIVYGHATGQDRIYMYMDIYGFS
jgi:hypothetical protein